MVVITNISDRFEIISKIILLTTKLFHSLLSHINVVSQVVVMRVSLHCQGCAGKLKKHLSKMEGIYLRNSNHFHIVFFH